MDKKAGIVGKAFATMDAIDGAKKVQNTFKKSVNNKFDNTMGTSISKGVSQNASNASISGMNKASQQIDTLCKQASFKSKKIGFLKRIVKADNDNSKYLRAMTDGIKNGQVNKAFSNGVKAAKVTIPSAIGMVGAGVGTSKGLKKIDEKINKEEVQPDRSLEYNTIGTGITAGLALGALSKGKMIAPYHAAGKVANNALIKMPLKAVRNSKAGKIVVDTLKNSANAMSKANKDLIAANKKAADAAARAAEQNERNIINIGKDIYNTMNNGKKKYNREMAIDKLIRKRKNNFIATEVAKGVSLEDANIAWEAEKTKLDSLIDEAVKKMDHGSKQASEYLDTLEKVAGAKSDYFKMVFKDHFIKEGLKSIPYYAAPAALSMALSTDLRHGMKKIDKDNADTSFDNETVKTAAFKTPKLNSQFSKEMFEKGVDGVARTVFPATVMTVTGRNITNAFEKIDTENSNRNMQEDMANKIIIQINGNDNKRKIKRDVSRQLNSALAKQASETPEKQILNNIMREIELQTGKNKAVNTNKIKIGLGIKKQFRMKQ